MDRLIDALQTIQDECKKHIMCKGCPMYEDGCIVQPVPAYWKIGIEKKKVGGVE